MTLTSELDLSAIHAFTFRLQELRRDPRERKAEALKAYFHEEWETKPENKELLSEALGL